MATDRRDYIEADFRVTPDGRVEPAAQSTQKRDYTDALHHELPDDSAERLHSPLQHVEMTAADYRVNPDGTVQQVGKPRARRGIAGSLLAAIIFIATKLKFVLASLKGVKFFATGATAFVSIGAYALAFGWQFGVGLVALIFVHEMGHVLALRRFGVKATAPIFIPFFGAFIGMKQLPKNAMMEAVVGLGGPIIGSLGALAAWIVYAINGHPIFLVLTYVGVLLNLFNLLPVLPLDGGRAVGVLSRWFWIIGFVFLVGAVVLLRNPFFLIILLFGAPEAWQRFRNRASEETEAYYQTPFAQRVAIGATYFGLIGVLGFALYHLGPVLVNGRPG